MTAQVPEPRRAAPVAPGAAADPGAVDPLERELRRMAVLHRRGLRRVRASARLEVDVRRER